MSRILALGCLVFALVGCSHSPEKITIAQPLVMGSELLSAGITADPPLINGEEGQKKALTILYNDRDNPLTLHYHYYWYDDQGLEIVPQETTQKVTVPAHSRLSVVSYSNNLRAEQVRVHLYL